MVNGVRFMISEEALTLGPGTRLDHSSFCVAEFYKIRKGTEKASDIGIRRGQKEHPLASVSNGIIYSLVITVNQKNVWRL